MKKCSKENGIFPLLQICMKQSVFYLIGSGTYNISYAFYCITKIGLSLEDLSHPNTSKQ